jgi:plasmid stabilization system protein ParE
MNVVYLPDAQMEMDDAVAYFRARSERLAWRFGLAYREALHNVVQHPSAWAPLSKNTRCCRLKRFQYGILYQLRDGEILIVAVMHLHRKPEYWKRRLQ